MKVSWKTLGCLLLGVPVVVTAVAIAIAIPNFLLFNCRAVQGEAKRNLQELARAEAAYHSEHGRYTADLGELRVSFDGRRYLFGFADGEGKRTNALLLGTSLELSTSAGQDANLPAETYADGSNFLAAAVGDLDGERGVLDVWSVDKSGVPVNSVNDCTLGRD